MAIVTLSTHSGHRATRFVYRQADFDCRLLREYATNNSGTQTINVDTESSKVQPI